MLKRWTRDMKLDARRAGDGQRAYRTGWLALIPGLVGTIGVLHASGMMIDGKALPICSLLVLLSSVQYFYARYRRVPFLALSTGSFLLMISSAFLAGMIANAGMRLRFSLIDAALAGADRAMGFDTAALVHATAERPLLADILNAAYSSIFPLTFVTAIVLAVVEHRQRLWELSVGFGAGIIVSAIVSVFFPAIGAFHYYGLESLSGNGLPAGSGIYHLHAVAAYREGISPLLDVRKLEGVVTFPSFHMIMAIAVAYAFRSTGFLGWAISIWCTVVAISAIPIGGHYVIDLVGGTIVWCLLRWAWSERAIHVSDAAYPGMVTAPRAIGLDASH